MNTNALMTTDLLSLIQRGRQPAPPRILIYGTEGIGKTTLGAQAPSPIFIQTEDGMRGLDADRFPVTSRLESIENALDRLAVGGHDYKTIVLDSVDATERIIWDWLCAETGAKSIEFVDGGYQRGYQRAVNVWRRVLAKLQTLNAQGLIVILIAHAKTEKFDDPMTSTYDRFAPRLHKTSSAVITEWVDVVAFATYSFYVKVDGSRKRVECALGNRVLRTVGSPACVAKNRYGLSGDLPLSWQDLYSPIDAFLKGSSNGNS